MKKVFALGLTLCALFRIFFPGLPLARAGTGTDAAAAGCGALSSGLLSAATTDVGVDPHFLSFQAVSGEEPPAPQAIAVQCYDYGSSYLDACWGSLSTDESWLSIDRGSFYGVNRVEVSVDPSGLEPGTYEGKIHISYDFGFDDEDVTVELVVEIPK